MKNTATRNGKEYPIMYVWNGGVHPELPKSRIVFFLDGTMCIAVDLEYESAFEAGEQFSFSDYEHWEPIPKLRFPTAFDIAKFVGDHPNALYRTQESAICSSYIPPKGKIDSISFTAKCYSLVVEEDPNTHFSIASDRIEYSLDEGKTWTHFMVEDDV